MTHEVILILKFKRQIIFISKCSQRFYRKINYLTQHLKISLKCKYKLYKTFLFFWLTCWGFPSAGLVLVYPVDKTMGSILFRLSFLAIFRLFEETPVSQRVIPIMSPHPAHSAVWVPALQRSRLTFLRSWRWGRRWGRLSGVGSEADAPGWCWPEPDAERGTASSLFTHKEEEKCWFCSKTMRKNRFDDCFLT